MLNVIIFFFTYMQSSFFKQLGKSREIRAVVGHYRRKVVELSLFNRYISDK